MDGATWRGGFGPFHEAAEQATDFQTIDRDALEGEPWQQNGKRTLST
jgi:hypothetical protein